MDSKLNLVLRRIPRKAVVTPAWLRAQGIDRNLTAHYLRSGWLTSIGSGAYARTGDDPDWAGALWSLQNAGKPLWVGGGTALELLGLAQNIALGRAPVVLFGAPRVKLPAWCQNAHWSRPLTLFTPALFSNPAVQTGSLRTATVGELSLQISTAERAVFELAYRVQSEADFEALDHAMQGMLSLRPALMQKLLDTCTLVRVTRLVLLLAEHYQLPWVKRINVSRIDLGSGKRQIWTGSAIHPKHQISVPRGFLNGSL